METHIQKKNKVEKGYVIVKNGQIPLFLMLITSSPLITYEDSDSTGLSNFEGSSFLIRSVISEIFHCYIVTDVPCPSFPVNTVNASLMG